MRSPSGEPSTYALIINPSAGGGRALKLLPAIREAMQQRGLRWRETLTRDVEHACDTAREAASAGEIPVVVSGDGLIGRVGGALADGERPSAPLGILPGGRGNDLARVLGIPTAPADAVGVLASDQRRRIDVGVANGERFLGIASCGFDSVVNAIANETTLVRGSLVYAYAALRALTSWKPARFEIDLDGETIQLRGYSVAAANSRAYGGGMMLAPTAELDDGELDLITTSDVSKLGFLASFPRVFRGTHIGHRGVELRRGAVVEIRADRRFDLYADGDRLTELPARIELMPKALEVIAPKPAAEDEDGGPAVSGRTRPDLGFGAKLRFARLLGALSRRSGRGGGTTLPGRVLLRLAPDAIARLATGLGRSRTVISATNGKTTTAGMIAAALAADDRRPVHNRAGSNMAWGVATALLEQGGEEGLFEVDEAWLPQVAEELEPTKLVLGNLFRDQLDRYGELERLADEWAQMIEGLSPAPGLVLNADDPLIADLGRDERLRRREGVLYFGVEDRSQALAELQHAFDAKHCRRCGTPYRYERAFVGHLGHYTCPGCGADRPRPDVAATAIELRGISGSSFTVVHPGGRLEVELPMPGLYNVYNALAAIAASLSLGVPEQRIAAGLATVEAAFGRVETIEVGGRSLSIMLIKNPAGANEVLRTVAEEAERSSEQLDLWVALNDRIADGRDVSWIWDADFELLDGHVRRVWCTGTRPAEMALRLQYAGWPRDRIEIVEGIEESLDAALASAAERVFALPTYTALIELRTLLAKRGLAKDFWA